jgi:hypothetical protein
VNNNTKYIVGVFSFIAFYTVFSFDFFSSVGVALFLFFGTKFFYEIGKKIEIRDVIILLASLQWIIGPLLAYKIYPDDDFYYMAVEIDIYMSFVVPATLAFALGLYLPITRKKISEKHILNSIKDFVKRYKNIDLTLISIGVVSELIIEIVPSSIRFVLFLFSGLRFIGLYFLFLSDRKYKNTFVFILLGWLFLTALRETLFHDLLLWLGFFIIIAAYITKPSLRKKVLYLLTIFILIITIQTVKHSFREALKEETGKGLGLFTELVKEKVFNSNYVASDTNLSAMVTRINQGWIIARIMSWTPSREPFAEGETIKEAVKATLLPRFLAPNKVIAGGRTYFTRFTGKDISEDTSMGLSLLGEAYANYAIFGGSLFMFIIGLFYNFFVFQIYKIANKHPTIIFFIPLIFLQVVKAETDFSVILNHLIKASIAVWMIYFAVRRFFHIKL